MAEPPAILLDTVDSRSCDSVATQLRLAGVSYLDAASERYLIPQRDIPTGEAFTAYCGGRFQLVKQNKQDELLVGDELIFDTTGYILGDGSLYVYEQSSSGNRYVRAELNPDAQAIPDLGIPTLESVTVTNHGLASISDPKPVMVDVESGSPTFGQYVLASKPLTGIGIKSDPTLRGLAFFATQVVDTNTLRGWHVMVADSLGEQAINGASFTPDTIAWLADDGSVSDAPGSYFVRLWRHKTDRVLQYGPLTISGSVITPSGGGGYQWLSAEYDILQDIPASTSIDLNSPTASYTTLRDAGTAHLSHSTANDYLSNWFIEIDGQTLSQDDFTVAGDGTIQVSRLIQTVANSYMVVWTQVAQ